MRRVSTALGLALFLLTAAGYCADPPDPPAGDTPMSLVRQALDADLAGRKEERADLLRRAIERAPLYAPARWQSGELFFIDQWLPVRQAQQHMAQDRLLKEYRQLRDSADGSAAAHAALARWCRKQQWKEREEFHWKSVLQIRPRNKEAIDALGLHEYRGMLLTAEQIAIYKKLAQRAEEIVRHWQPILAQAQERLEGEDPQLQSQAREQIQNIRDPAAIGVLAQSLPQGSEAYALAVIGALANMEEQSATDVLTWQALASRYDDVRQAAIDALKKRPLYSYVPILLGSLSSPLELTWYVNAVAPGQVKYGYQVLRDGPLSQTAITYSVSSEVFRLSDAPLELHPQSAVGRAIQARGAGTTRAAVVTQVSAANQATERRNEHIFTALEQTTGQTYSTPQAWWNWWVRHNELFVAEHKPLHSRHYYYHRPMAIRDRLHPQLPPPLGPRRTSCFIAGTLVWAENGLEPIENLRPGDRVLSQDPDTGELALRFVLETTLRPASPTRRVQVGEEVIVATLGHPFWAAGKGWRMAKELEAVDRLHTLEGAVPIASVEDGPDWEAHNLVIEGFGTYFVGKAGLLVRDNNLGEVVTTPLPGYGTVAAGAPAR